MLRDGCVECMPPICIRHLAMCLDSYKAMTLSPFVQTACHHSVRKLHYPSKHPEAIRTMIVWSHESNPLLTPGQLTQLPIDGCVHAESHNFSRSLHVIDHKFLSAAMHEIVI